MLLDGVCKKAFCSFRNKIYGSQFDYRGVISRR